VNRFHPRPQRAGRVFTALCLLLLSVVLAGCDGPVGGARTLAADMPLHLEEHLDAATIVGSELPEAVPEPIKWRFDELQAGWSAAIPQPFPAGIRPAEVSWNNDALQITLGPANANLSGRLVGGASVEVRVRPKGGLNGVALSFNYTEEDPGLRNNPFYSLGDRVRVVSDGAVQTYRFSLEWEDVRARYPDTREIGDGPWTHLGVMVTCPGDRAGASLEINPSPRQVPERQRPGFLLLYDLWNDYWCLEPVNDQHPELVEKYTASLAGQWEAHQALAQLLTPSDAAPLTPDQLESLRALGYIR